MTDPTMHTVSFKSEYSNPLAQAASVASGLAASFRTELELATPNGEAQDCVFHGAALIVDGWLELECADDKESLASYKASLSRECRKMYGFGCKVVNSQLIGTKVGAGKGAKEKDSDLVKAVKAWELTATPQQIAEALAVFAAK